MTDKYLHQLIFSKAAIVLLLSFVSFQAFSQKEGAPSKTGMLILGSANINTLRERVNVGAQLYGSGITFDYIIVSGGCAAHGSKICEAAKMDALLQEKGVPASNIFKEEKSKSTVQNYCYSKLLKKADGTPVINEGDTVYVVSSHWHAIPVAGCLTKEDMVTALYHIEGRILPEKSDKVDYTNIYQNCTASDYYCKSALWPWVDASYYNANSGQKGDMGKTHYFIDDIYYQKLTDGAEEPQVKSIAEATVKLPAGWTEEIDAAYYDKRKNKVYYFKGAHYLRFTPNAKTIDAGYPRAIKDWIKGLPNDWHGGYVDAAFFDPSVNDVYLFKGNEYLQFSSRNGKIGKGFPKNINELAMDWPFSWSNGGIDAANYNSKKRKLYLFRGQEHIQIIMDGDMKVVPGCPQTTQLAWPNALWGERP